MIKIRGYRVDMSDVESNIRNIKYVNQCVIFEKNKKNYENFMCGAIETNENKVSNIKYYQKIAIIYDPKQISCLKFPTNSNGKLIEKNKK